VTRHPLTHRMVRAWFALALLASAGLYGVADARPAVADENVTVSLSTMTPTNATSSSGKLTLTGKVNIPSGQSHDDVIMQLAYAPVNYTSQLGDGPSDTDEQLYSVQDDLQTLSSGSHPWTLQTSISAMGLAPGYVYALDVEAYSGGDPLGGLRTYLPYKIGGDGGHAVGSTKLAVLAPVTSPSPLDGYQESISGALYPELTEETLAESMAGGSLYQLLAGGAQLPKGTVSWAVDPDLLNAAQQIDGGYVVAKSGTASDELGPDSNDAFAWLKEAKTVLGSSAGELWQLPATDPDLGSLSQAPTAQAEQLLSDATEQSVSGGTVKSLTGRAPQGLLAWPADGQVSPATLSLAESINPAAVVVDSGSIGLSVPDDEYAPTGRASVNGKNNLVVGDDGLDAIMSGDPADATYDAAGSNDALMAGQRLLAQTALIAMQKPNLARTLLLTLPRTTSTAALDMGVLKNVLASASWLSPTGLSALLGQSPDPDASTGTPSRSSSTAAADLSTAQLNQALSLESQLQLYQSILTKSDSTTTGFAEAVLRTVSTGWRGNSAEWAAFESAVTSRLASLTGQVYLIPKSDLTLSGTSGSIPFTVVNHLSQPVRLGLDVQTNRTGLHVTQIPLRTFPIGESTVEVKVTAEAPGAKVEVTAYLVNAGGARYGTAKSRGSQSLQVTVTSIGFVALLLFAGSAALLVFAVGWRIYRGRRRSRNEPATRASDEPPVRTAGGVNPGE
jgi:Family of unknown function (DUF6049)